MKNNEIIIVAKKYINHFIITIFRTGQTYRNAQQQIPTFSLLRPLVNCFKPTAVYCMVTSSGVGPTKKCRSTMPPMVRRVRAGVPLGSMNVEYSGTTQMVEKNL